VAFVEGPPHLHPDPFEAEVEDFDGGMVVALGVLKGARGLGKGEPGVPAFTGQGHLGWFLEEQTHVGSNFEDLGVSLEEVAARAVVDVEHRPRPEKVWNGALVVDQQVPRPQTLDPGLDQVEGSGGLEVEFDGVTGFQGIVLADVGLDFFVAGLHLSHLVEEKLRVLF